MTTARLPQIEKGLVHKQFAKNVHITEIYREIPGRLPAEVYDAAYSYGGEAAELLERYFFADRSDEFACAGFPVVLSEGEYRELLRRVRAPEASLLERAFPVAGAGRAFDPGTGAGGELYRIFRSQNMAAGEVEEKILSDRLEQFEYEKPMSFRGRLVVDPSHAYWFEHPNEHIPGMLLIEGGRQMCLAVGHAFGGIPLSGVHNVIGEINVRFFNYADISHEIRIKTVVENVRLGREGFWIWGLLHVHFYQHEKELGSLSIDSAVVKSKVLNRIRNKVARPGYRYVPHEGIKVPIYLERDGRRFPGVVENLNLNGFQATFDPDQNFQREGEYEFFIFFETVGYIAGRARFLWNGRSRETGRRENRSGFKIRTFNGDEDRRLLDELLKRFFYVNRYG